MNTYEVTINNHQPVRINAGRSRIAVGRAMAEHLESEYRPAAQIRVRFIGKVKPSFDVVGEVPFDYGENGKGFSKTTLANNYSKEAAEDLAEKISAAHPEYRFVRVVKRTR